MLQGQMIAQKMKVAEDQGQKEAERKWLEMECNKVKLEMKMLKMKVLKQGIHFGMLE